MAVTLKGQSAIYEGTSADMKPSDAAKNAIFQELDTGIDYYYDGTDWNEIPSSGGGGGGTGTDNYNELNNKPSINGTVLSGNKSLDNLGIQAKLTFDNAPTSGSSNPVKSDGVYSALGGKQDVISDLPSIRSGAAAGATAVQPAAMETALDSKQDALSSEQLDAVNSGITSADVEQITTNKNNILLNEQMNGKKNYCKTNNVTFTGYNQVIYTDAISGDAVLYIGNINSTDTDSSENLVIFYNTNNQQVGQRLCRRGQPVVYDNIELGANVLDHLVLYSSDNYAHSSGDTVTYTDIMICSKAAYTAFPAYQPYAMSNAELTAAIQALQAQLANQ